MARAFRVCGFCPIRSDCRYRGGFCGQVQLTFYRNLSGKYWEWRQATTGLSRTGSAPDAVGLAQRLVDRPRAMRAGWKIRGVPGLELEAATVLRDECRMTADEMAELRGNYCTREGARRGLPGAGLDGTVRRGPGFGAAERRSRQVTDWRRHEDLERTRAYVRWLLDVHNGH